MFILFLEDIVKSATELEANMYSLTKKRKQREWFTKMSDNIGLDLDENIQDEMKVMDHEIVKKTKAVTKHKEKYAVAQANLKYQSNNKRKSVFLDPFKIREISNIIEKDIQHGFKPAPKGKSVQPIRTAKKPKVPRNRGKRKNFNRR
jgi:hypothetical protein